MGRPGNPRLPIGKNPLQLLPHCHEVFDLLIQPVQFLFEKTLHLTARRATFVPNLQDLRELGKRKPHRQSTPDQSEPIHGLGRVETIVAGGSPRQRQDFHALVMPQRIGADTNGAGNFAGPEIGSLSHPSG